VKVVRGHRDEMPEGRTRFRENVSEGEIRRGNGKSRMWPRRAEKIGRVRGTLDRAKMKEGASRRVDEKGRKMFG
jgi:hypothetical protein